MRNGTVKAIVFDLDGTLVHFECEYREILAGAFRNVCSEVRDGWQTYRYEKDGFGTLPDALRRFNP